MPERDGAQAGSPRGPRTLWPALIAGFIPYVAMVVGIPFVNSGRDVLGLPELGLWIVIWTVLSTPFLVLAYRLLPASERDEDDGSPNDPTPDRAP